MAEYHFTSWSIGKREDTFLLMTKIPTKTRWRAVMKAMTAVARAYGYYKKRLTVLEGYGVEDSGYDNFVEIFATRHPTRIGAFDLWEWKAGKFHLIRKSPKESGVIQ